MKYLRNTTLHCFFYVSPKPDIPWTINHVLSASRVTVKKRLYTAAFIKYLNVTLMGDSKSQLVNELNWTKRRRSYDFK